jgi:hypothetical protein
MLPNATQLPKSHENLEDRQITQDEINKIAHQCPSSREKAFFTFMRQSGLQPHTIKQLKIKHVERILGKDTPIPCKITQPYEGSPAFIGYEAVRYLKQYLEDRAKRTKLTQESLLFTALNNPNKEINTKNVSRAFRKITQRLKVNYKTEKGQLNDLTLRNLTQFYKEKAKDYLTELNKGTKAKSDAFYRKLYEKQAMQYLEIEPPTPLQIHKLEKENAQLKEQLAQIERSMPPVTRLYHEILGILPPSEFSDLKIEKPTKNEDRDQWIQKGLHKIVESIKEDENQRTQDKSNKKTT